MPEKEDAESEDFGEEDVRANEEQQMLDDLLQYIDGRFDGAGPVTILGVVELAKQNIVARCSDYMVSLGDLGGDDDEVDEADGDYGEGIQ